MLFVTRRFKMLFGFLTGAALLVGITTAFDGVGIWPVYSQFLSLFGHVVGVNGQSALNLSKYIDFGSVSHMLPGGRSAIGLAILICMVAAIAAVLAFLWWKSAACAKPTQCLVWATTLTWTLLLNVYVPIYDSVLVVIAIILTLGALKKLRWDAAAGWVVLMSLLIFAGAWETEAIVRSHRIQILSLLIAALGAGQLFLLHRAIRQKVTPMESGRLAE
jgi:hypothetical protein